MKTADEYVNSAYPASDVKKGALRMKKGFTLIELAIVLAVIAIVGAVILPNFLTTTDRSRLKADVQSARVLQNAADLYDAEQPSVLPRTDVSADIVKMTADGYLPKDVGAIQTTDAKWVYDSNKNIKVNIAGCTAKVKELAGGLDPQEQAMLTGR